MASAYTVMSTSLRVSIQLSEDTVEIEDWRVQKRGATLVEFLSSPAFLVATPVRFRSAFDHTLASQLPARERNAENTPETRTRHIHRAKPPVGPTGRWR